jgi:hypothetical protein
MTATSSLKGQDVQGKGQGRVLAKVDPGIGSSECYDNANATGGGKFVSFVPANGGKLLTWESRKRRSIAPHLWSIKANNISTGIGKNGRS